MCASGRGPTRSPLYLAHSPNDEGAGVGEPVHEHLRRVAERAARFAQVFGAEQQAHAAGLLHDLGKYADRFQGHLNNPSHRAGDHWSAGACLLAGRLGPQVLVLAPALAVEGHHAGLGELPARAKDWANEIAKRMKRMSDAFTDTEIARLYKRYRDDRLPDPVIKEGVVPSGLLAADMLDVRMIYSCLVDADFLETEAHFNGDATTPRRPRPEGPTLDVEKALAALDRHVQQLSHRFADSPMAATREQLLERCIEAARQSTGLFSLSAPTGAGKTLAMLAFALHHAHRHNLRRIVLVMPFLNIIEQTAKVYRFVFCEENGFDALTVLEDHSLVEYEPEHTDVGDDYTAALPRLLAENWDAPVVLTTSVQFFESLFASRPSRCRKLHRLARSVILFDEVQTLPVKLAVATLATLSRLAQPDGPYRSTVLFATATQPEFQALDGRVREFAGSGWQPTGILPDPAPLYRPAAARVSVEWRHQQPIPLEELAERIQRHQRVLCIVNLKRHASRLAETLVELGAQHVFHLSTNMCPAHRSAVLATVDGRLQRGEPVRLVATQCVEAGVDLDFPVVYRALAPLEAIAQAAGRCNRHGRDPRGRVVVFKPQDEQGIYPPGYRQAVQATELFLADLARQGDLDDTEILNSPDRLRGYFNQLYVLTGRTSGEMDDERTLLDAIRAGNFQEVADLYRLIKQDSINVLVRYDTEAFEALRAELGEAERLTPRWIRRWIRRATPHAVGLFRPKDHDAIWNLLEPAQFSRRRLVENYEASWFIALEGLGYDAMTGLVVPGDVSFVL